MYFKRKDFSTKGHHILSYDDIFENENRKKIISKILQEPGIHNNELLRQCDLQKGQLQWHLYVLMQYGIIKKEKVGQFSVYFPIKMAKNPNQYSRLLIGKSKTSLKVLDLIEKNPGINSSIIALQLFLNRSTVKYHIDKLKKEKLINLKHKGRKIELFPNKNFD
jgi:predicted transcriptional regulator